MKHIFAPETAPKVKVLGPCPACGVQSNYVNAQQAVDRYGFDVRISVCNLCSMCWLAERMTPAAYADFYASGAYRRLVSAFHGREITEDSIRPEQREYARRLLAVMRPWLERMPLRGRGLLDVGSATGEVGRRVAAHRVLGTTIIDPAAQEDPGQAVRVIRASAEDAQLDHEYDVILLCQTIDHLLDPAAVLEKLRRHLVPGGLFFVDALDYEITRELKIDHPHNFTEKALLRLLDRTGWTVATVTRWNRHVGALCTA